MRNILNKLICLFFQALSLYVDNTTGSPYCRTKSSQNQPAPSLFQIPLRGIEPFLSTDGKWLKTQLTLFNEFDRIDERTRLLDSVLFGAFKSIITKAIITPSSCYRKIILLFKQ